MFRWIFRAGKYQKLPLHIDEEEGHSSIAGDAFEKSDHDARGDNENVGRDSESFSDPWRSLTPPALPPFPRGAHWSWEETKAVPARQRDVQGIGQAVPRSSDPWRSLTPPPPEEWHRPRKDPEAAVAVSPDARMGKVGSDATDPWGLPAPPPLPPSPQNKHSPQGVTETIASENERRASGSTSHSTSSTIFGGLLAPKYVMRGWKERTQGKNVTSHGG
jgi:hypothetical protein